MGKLAGKRVLIVGGGSGIGLAVARAAIGEGAKVVIASTNEARLRLAAETLGGADRAVLDICDEPAVADWFGQSGMFDHIVTTAGDWGTARRAATGDLDVVSAETLFRVRFWGAVILAKHGAKCLNPGGSLTLTSGMSAYRPQKTSVIATAMAGSVEHLTFGLAVDLAPLRVNAVLPGGVRTEIWDGLPEAMRAAESARFERQLIPRIAEPDEVAEAYLYLMKAGYTTGQVLQVDGGSVLA